MRAWPVDSIGETRLGGAGDGHMDTFLTIEADGSLTAMTHISDFLVISRASTGQPWSPSLTPGQPARPME